MSKVEGVRESSAPARTYNPLDLKGLIDAFMRRWRIFAGIVLGAVVMAVAASLILRPVYQSTVTIRIDPVQKSAVDVDAIARGDPPDQALVDSEVKLMESRDVVRAVVHSMNLTADPEFTKGGDHGNINAPPDEFVTDAVLKGLKVEREGTTYIVDLSFKSFSAGKATGIANNIASEYLRQSVQARNQAAQEQAAGMQDRLTQLDTDVKQADAAVATYKAANGIVGATNSGTVTEQQIATVTQQLATAESAATVAESNYQAAKQQIARGGIDSVSSVMNSPTIIALRAQRVILQSAQAEDATRYGPKHPETIKVQQQAQDLDRQILDESNRVVAGMESEARASAASAASLRSELNQLVAQESVNSRSAVVADTMQREAEAKRSTYNQIATSAQTLNQIAQSNQSQARLVSPASVPTKPVFPNKLLFAALGAALGVTLGLAGVFAAELFDSGLRTIDEVRRELGVEYIASIPLLTPKALKVDGKTVVPWDYVKVKPMSGYAESMRGIRSALNLSDMGAERKVIALTSALPNEGKTACAVALARTMAMSGERVVLLDCDLRRNSLEGLVTTKPSVGLVEVLAGAAPLSAALAADSVDGLDVLCIYKETFTPRDIFGNPRMKELLSELRRRYDHVILDCPPILAVNDAQTLASMSDAVVMIAHWNSTPRRAVRAAIDLLERDQAPIVGLVLSMVAVGSRSAMSSGDSSYYYERLRHYYQD